MCVVVGLAPCGVAERTNPHEGILISWGQAASRPGMASVVVKGQDSTGTSGLPGLI